MSTSVHPLLGLMQPTANAWRCAGKVRAILFWYSALVQRVELLCLLSAAARLGDRWRTEPLSKTAREPSGNRHASVMLCPRPEHTLIGMRCSPSTTFRQSTGVHIHTINPIESTFATVRLRTAKTRGCMHARTCWPWFSC